MASKVRTEAACLRDAMDAEQIEALFRGGKKSKPAQPAKAFQPVAEVHAPEWTPTYSLERFIATARAEMGEARWEELNREWLA